MPDNVCVTFVRNDVNGDALFDMQRDDFKEIGMTKEGPLVLLLKKISSLRTKPIFVKT